jgi:hypothetical protein
MPPGRKDTYASFVVDIKEQKEERERTILTVGGDQIEYPGDKSTRTTGLATSKILINSVFCCQDPSMVSYPKQYRYICGND